MPYLKSDLLFWLGGIPQSTFLMMETNLTVSFGMALAPKKSIAPIIAPGWFVDKRLLSGTFHYRVLLSLCPACDLRCHSVYASNFPFQ